MTPHEFDEHVDTVIAFIIVYFILAPIAFIVVFGWKIYSKVKGRWYGWFGKKGDISPIQDET